MRTEREVDLQQLGSGWEQRNWSRVRRERTETGTTFAKQFVTRNGERREDLYDAELLGAAEVARMCEGASMRTPQVVASTRRDLEIRYEWIAELVDLGRLRRSAEWEPGVLEPVGRSLCSLLRLPSTGAAGSEPFMNPVVGLEDLEIRNVGIDAAGVVWVFDSGRPWRTSAAAVVARLVVSALLLTWGRPLSLMVRGPDRVAAATLARSLPWCRRGDLVGELVFQARARLRVQADTRLERAAKLVGLLTVGTLFIMSAAMWACWSYPRLHACRR